MTVKAIIYPDYNDGSPILGERLPFFYMHGVLEKIVGFDCCNGNIYAFRKALAKCIAIVETEWGKCLMFVYGGHYGHDGMIVLVNDLQAIKEVLESHSSIRNDMYDDEKDYLKKHHLQSYNLIFKS